MDQQKIELRKVRDFGENISDTFIFIRENFGRLVGIIFAICGIFMLGKGIMQGFYQAHAFGIFDQMRRGRMYNNEFGGIFQNIFTPEYILSIFLAYLLHISMHVTIACYVKIYLDQNGELPTLIQVWKLFSKYYFRAVVYSFPVILLIILGTICCLAPGVWLGVVLMPFQFIIVIEDAGFATAWIRCFQIIKNNYWISLLIYIVAAIIVFFASGILGTITALVVGLGTFLSTNQISTTAGVVTAFLNIFQGIFTIIFLVSAILNYFSLVENTDGTGMLARIDTIGENSPNQQNADEQY